MLEKIFSPFLIYKVYYPILSIIIGILLYQIGKKAIHRMFDVKIKRQNKGTNKRQKTIESLVINVYKYILFIIVILVILSLYGINTTALLASLGVVGLVFGLACQDTIKDLLAGIFIILDNAYNVGDFVNVDNFEGEVVEFGLKTTKIKSFAGEIKTVMNSSISSIVNYNAANAVKMIDIDVDYGTDLEKCEKILTMLCEDLSKSITNLKADLQLLGVEELSSSSIVYRIRAEASYQDIFAIKREILREVKLTFDQHHIKIPYNKLEIVHEK